MVEDGTLDLCLNVSERFYTAHELSLLRQSIAFHNERPDSYAQEMFKGDRLIIHRLIMNLYQDFVCVEHTHECTLYRCLFSATISLQSARFIQFFEIA